jgi:hypothetical protein
MCGLFFHDVVLVAGCQDTNNFRALRKLLVLLLSLSFALVQRDIAHVAPKYFVTTIV